MSRNAAAACIAEVCATEFERAEAARERAAIYEPSDLGRSYAEAIAQLMIMTAERDAVIRQRDAWADAYHSLSKLLNVPEC